MKMGLRILLGSGMLLFGVVGLMAVSCGRPTGGGETRNMEEIPESARHAVQSERLRQIMDDLERQVAKTWPQEIQVHKEALTERQRQEKFRKAATLAEDMREASGTIPEAVAKVPMSTEQREEFDKLVRQMQFQTAELEAAARAQRDDTMQDVFADIKTTCKDCHDRFGHVIPAISKP